MNDVDDSMAKTEVVYKNGDVEELETRRFDFKNGVVSLKYPDEGKVRHVNLDRIDEVIEHKG